MRDEINRLVRQYQMFHWHLAFPDVFRIPTEAERPENRQTGWSGGFDVVIGNPPYIFGENQNKKTKACFQSTFQVAKDQYNLYWLFIEQSLNLVKAKGGCSLVVPDALLARDETTKLRELILQKGLVDVCDCGTPFDAGVSTVIFTTSGKESSGSIIGKALEESQSVVKNVCNKNRFREDPKHRFLIYMSDEEASVLSRIDKSCDTLKYFAKISRGEEVGKKDTSPVGDVPIIAGEDISRYELRKPSRFLKTFQKDASLYQSPKIVILKTGTRCIASLDRDSSITMQSVYNLHITEPKLSYEALLALLNSQLVDYYIYKTFTSYKKLFPQINQSTIEAIPLSLGIIAMKGKLYELVNAISLIKEDLWTAKEHTRALLLAKSDILEQEIDKIVYNAYGLSNNEVDIISSNAPKH